MKREHFDISTAPFPHSEAAYHDEADRPAGHVQGVDASPGGLLRATLGSALAGGAILVFAWLPAEYGIDPTGVGGLLGLTEMGEIKQQLYAEAEAEDAAIAAQVAATLAQSNTDPAIAERLASIESQVAAIAAVAGARPQDATSTPHEVEALVEEVAATPAEPEAPAEVAPSTPADAAAPGWRDEVSYTLAIGEGIEVKLAMTEGAVAKFEWTANGAVLNHDTHGAGGGESITYEKGRGVPGQQGELVAAFTGNHGWFWRNRTDAPVTFTLRTRGDYREVISP